MKLTLSQEEAAAWAATSKLGAQNGICIPTSSNRTRSLGCGVYCPVSLRAVLAVGMGMGSGAPYHSHLFMMIVGVYATLGVFY